MAVNETILTQKQKQVLKLRNKGYSQEEIAQEWGTTKQNISSIERMAWKKVKRAENTIKFVKMLKAPVWFTMDKNADLDDVVGRIYLEADKKNIHITHDGLSLATKIREDAMDKIKHRVVLKEFEVGITEDGEIILI
jgi:hypothetical protein